MATKPRPPKLSMNDAASHYARAYERGLEHGKFVTQRELEVARTAGAIAERARITKLLSEMGFGQSVISKLEI